MRSSSDQGGMTRILLASTPLASMRCFMKRSSAMMRSARCKLCSNMRDNTRATKEFGCSHPAAMASYGLRSIDQNTKLRARLGSAKLATKEIRGGDVIAITTSNFGNDHTRKAQLAMNVPKSAARRHLELFPSAVAPQRTILTPFQVSSLGNRTFGSS